MQKTLPTTTATTMTLAGVALGLGIATTLSRGSAPSDPAPIEARGEARTDWRWESGGVVAAPGATDREVTPAEPVVWRDYGALLEPEASQGAGGPVALGSRLSHPLLLEGPCEDVYLYVTLSGAEATGTARPDMNLALVIDRSGSMGSERKLEFAKKAAEKLVSRLRSEDRLALVVYDDEVDRLVPSMPAWDNREAFVSAIRRLEPGGSTNLFGGMLVGQQEVYAGLDERRINRVLLLSDGLANRGITGRHEIGKRVSRWREQGVRVSTMGVGIEYDDQLMKDVAARSGGNYYYVDQAEAIVDHLDAELRELSQIVAKDLMLEVRLGPGVEVRDVYGYRHSLADDTLRVPLPDVFGGERRKVVVRLSVPAGRGERPVAQTSLRYRDVETQEARRMVAPPNDASTTDDPREVERGQDLIVMSKAELARNAAALKRAGEHQRQGEFELAQRLLEERWAASKALNDTHLRSEELARLVDRMHDVAMEIERTKDDRWAREDLNRGVMSALESLGYMGDD